MAKIDLSAGATSSPVPASREQWIDWCWERNQRAMEHGWRRWLFVKDTDVGIQVEQLGGDDTTEVWAMINDKPYVPYRWTEVNIRKLMSRVQWYISRGMSPDAYMLWSAENRAVRRKAIIDREIELMNRGAHSEAAE